MLDSPGSLYTELVLDESVLALIWRLACRSHKQVNEPPMEGGKGKDEVRGRDVATKEKVY